MKYWPFLLCASVFAMSAGTSSLAADDFSKRDLNGDGKLSPQEHAGTVEEFRALDTNADGSLDAAEFGGGANLDIRNVETAKRQLLGYGATIRAWRVRYDSYPATLEDLRAKRMLDTVAEDPWGNAYQYELLANPDGKHPDKKDWWKISCAGADGIFGTQDDIVNSRSGLRLALSETHRAHILSEGGANYELSRMAFAIEQQFRFWLRIAEEEYTTGSKLISTADLVFPSDIFPDTPPSDCFGRVLQLRTARGIRAVLADGGSGEKGNALPAASMSEADFVKLLDARLSAGGNENWRTSNMIETVQQFYRAQGRLPLTMAEITASASDAWQFRQNDGEMTWYLTFNRDRGFVFISSGSDRAPGGTGDNQDQVVYGPSDINALAPGAPWLDRSAEQARYKAIRDAILARAKAKREAKPEPAPGDNSDTTPAVPKNQSRAPNGHELSISSSFVRGTWLATGRSAHGMLWRPHLLQAAEENPDPSSTTNEAETGANKAAVITDPLELIPNRLYTRVEASQCGVCTRNENEWNVLDWQAETLFGALLHWGSTVREGETLPEGNIALSNGKGFLEKANREWERADWGEEAMAQAFLVAKFEIGAFGHVKSLVCIAVPKAGLSEPLVVYAQLDGERAGPLYASLAEQPTGWLQAALAYDGKKQVKIAAPVEPKGEDAEGAGGVPDEHAEGAPAEATPAEAGPAEEAAPEPAENSD